MKQTDLLLTRCLNFINDVAQAIRIISLNKLPGISISKRIFLDKSARVILNADGYNLGGTVTIAEGVRISNSVIIAPYGGSIEIKENVYIGPFCVLYGHGGLTIGRNSLIAAHSVLIPADHGFADTTTPIYKQPMTKKGIIIENNVWVGAGVKVLDGVTIGSGSVIGAGAVVTKSIPKFTVAIGVPAKEIKVLGENYG